MLNVIKRVEELTELFTIPKTVQPMQKHLVFKSFYFVESFQHFYRRPQHNVSSNSLFTLFSISIEFDGIKAMMLY